jgi:hypothetical protein
MRFVLDIAWTLVGVLKFGSLAVVLAGVALFGWNFVGINARAAQTARADVPAESWRGPGAINGFKLMALGFAMLVASFLLSALLPGRL